MLLFLTCTCSPVGSARLREAGEAKEELAVLPLAGKLGQRADAGQFDIPLFAA